MTKSNPPCKVDVYRRCANDRGSLVESFIFENEESALDWAGRHYGGVPGYICITSEFPVFFDGVYKPVTYEWEDEEVGAAHEPVTEDGGSWPLGVRNGVVPPEQNHASESLSLETVESVSVLNDPRMWPGYSSGGDVAL